MILVSIAGGFLFAGVVWTIIVLTEIRDELRGARAELQDLNDNAAVLLDEVRQLPHAPESLAAD